MKKLFCLLLTVSLLMPASFALAEETSLRVREPSESPNIFFGGDQRKALEYFNSTWRSNFSYSDTPVWQTVTMADGTTVYIMVLAAVSPEDGKSIPMTAKFYFINEKLAAAVQEISIPEGTNPSMIRDNFVYVMGGAPVPLDLGKIRNAIELLGEDAHLEAGQDAWPYVAATYTDANTGEGRATLDAMVTFRAEGDIMYVAEFPYSKSAGKYGAAQDLSKMEGYDKLTEEEQNMVKLYAEFLQKQQNETLEQYIDFLVKKHQ